MRTQTILLAPALALALLGCGALNEQLYLEIEQPELCKVLPNQQFTGSEFQRRLEVNVAQQLPGLNFDNPQGMEGTFRIPRVSFIARSGISNFDFVDTGRIHIEPPAGATMPPVDVINYARNGASTTGTLDMAGESDINLYDYLRGGVLTAVATIAGTLPRDNWSMDIQVCLYARIKVSYADAANAFKPAPPPPP